MYIICQSSLVHRGGISDDDNLHRNSCGVLLPIKYLTRDNDDSVVKQLIISNLPRLTLATDDFKPVVSFWQIVWPSWHRKLTCPPIINCSIYSRHYIRQVYSIWFFSGCQHESVNIDKDGFPIFRFFRFFLFTRKNVHFQKRSFRLTFFFCSNNDIIFNFLETYIFFKM